MRKIKTKRKYSEMGIERLKDREGGGGGGQK